MRDHREPDVITDGELARLLEIGYVLETIVEARSDRHTTVQSIEDTAVRSVLAEARSESRRHRERLEQLLAAIGRDPSVSGNVAALVESRYDRSTIDCVDDVLQDQLASELSAYQFYDTVLAHLRRHETSLTVDIDEVVTELEEIREDERDGAVELAQLIGAYGDSVSVSQISEV